jgi:hydroxymethylglutaryl-CoA synthase
LEETEGGDAAAAFYFGHGDQPIAEVIGAASRTTELMDIWRTPGARHAVLSEERFSAVTIEALVKDVLVELADATGHREPPTYALVSTLSARLAATIAKSINPHKSTVMQQAHRHGVGYCGAADAGVLLAQALDDAKAGDTILVVCASGGADVLLLRVLRDGEARRTSPSNIGLPYLSYLTWRGWLEREPARRPERSPVSSPASYRNQAWKYGLQGSRCTKCGGVHLPPQRVCATCGAMDATEVFDASNRPAHIAAFSTDLVSDSPAPPAVAAMIDFEGGGRVMLELADVNPEQLSVGDPVRISFRRTYVVNGTPNYFWKACPSKEA